MPHPDPDEISHLDVGRGRQPCEILESERPLEARVISGKKDGYVSPWREPSDLLGSCIDQVGQRLSPYPAEVEEGVSLGGSAVTHDLLSPRPCVLENSA